MCNGLQSAVRAWLEVTGIVDRWSAPNITDSTSERRLVGRWCAREWGGGGSRYAGWMYGGGVVLAWRVSEGAGGVRRGREGEE